MKCPKVRQLISAHSGNAVANQFMIQTPEAEYFQSFRSIIVKFDHRTDKIILDRKTWAYSKTTGKYRNQVLGENKKETERKIKEGIYPLEELND